MSSLGRGDQKAEGRGQKAADREELLDTVLFFAGITLVILSAWMVFPPAGVFTTGLVLIAFAWATAGERIKNDKEGTKKTKSKK